MVLVGRAEKCKNNIQTFEDSVSCCTTMLDRIDTRTCLNRYFNMCLLAETRFLFVKGTSILDRLWTHQSLLVRTTELGCVHIAWLRRPQNLLEETVLALSRRRGHLLACNTSTRHFNTCLLETLLRLLAWTSELAGD